MGLARWKSVQTGNQPEDTKPTVFETDDKKMTFEDWWGLYKQMAGIDNPASELLARDAAEAFINAQPPKPS